MQLKSILISALLGVSTVVEASTIPSRSLVPRQRGGNRFGNNFQNGGGNNNNGGNNGGNNNNQGAAQGNNNNNGGNNNNNNNNNAAATCLNANAVQTGSASDGQNGQAEAGQVASATDAANFINFCSGKTLTNGLQVRGGSCNGIVMGDMPAQSKMVSTILTSPAHNDNIPANKDFTVQLKIANLQAGFFTNAQATYYSAPQQLNGNGEVIGHTHVTIQDLGNSLTPTQPLDASQFVFFKGINDAGDGKGGLSATVTGGLPAGNYRVCTMSGAANHQPVLMPVAQRGTQEDCNKFTVSDNAGGNNNNNNNNGGNANNGGNKNAGNANAGNANAGNANAGNANAGNNAGNKNGGNNAGNNNSGSNNNNNNNANSNNNQNNGNQNGTANNAGANGANANAGTGGTGGTGGASAAKAIGGIAAPQVQDSGNADRPFSVNGNTFVNKSAAVERACAIQNNACADAVNSGSISGFTVGDCSNQESACAAELA